MESGENILIGVGETTLVGEGCTSVWEWVGNEFSGVCGRYW